MAGTYRVAFTPSAAQELDELRVFDQRKVVEAIQRNLTHNPEVPSRNRKCLFDLRTGFPHQSPLWELRVGEFRVFYDVDAGQREVAIRAVRRKAPHQTTEEITREGSDD